MGRLELWVRSEWRSGWRALTGLALVVAIGGGLTMAAWAGARRADSAFDRFLARVSGPLAVSAVGMQTTLSAFDDTWALAPEIAAMDGVTGVRPTSWMAVAMEIEGVPQSFFSPALGLGYGPNPPAGGHVIRGRSASAADEVVINEVASHMTGKAVGDSIVLRSYATDQADAFIDSTGEPGHGPTVEARIVGVYRSPEDISDNPEPMALLSTQFYDRYAGQIAHCDCSIWIGAASADVARVSTGVEGVVSGSGLVVERLDNELRPRVERAIGLEVGALRIAAAITAVATGLVVVQALSRHIATRGVAPALMAIGSTRPQIVRGWITVLMPAVVVGALGAVGVATLASPMFPRGIAKRAEIAPGMHFDTVALPVGAIVLTVLVILIATLVSWRSARANRSRGRDATGPGRIASMLNPPAAIGTSFALSPSRGRSRVVAFSAMASLALAIGGPIAVALIERSIDDVLVTPSAFAADWDMQLTAQPEDPDALIAAVMADRSIDAFAVQYQVSGNKWVVTAGSGTDLVSPVAFDAMIGTMGPILVRGRLSHTADDVVVGIGTARHLGVDVGDEVVVDAGPNGPQTFRVSGVGRLSDGDDTDTAFVTTPEGLARLQPADRQAVNGAFVRLGTGSDDSVDALKALGFAATLPPSRVMTLGQIGTVPRLLAMALVALGLGGVLHSLLVAGSRRSSEIAIAKALGFTRGQAASTIRWQGVVTWIVAALAGVPLGLFVGRVAWKRVASGVGAVDLVSIPWQVVIAAPLAVLAIVVAAGSLVGRRVALLPTARILRAE